MIERIFPNVVAWEMHGVRFTSVNGDLAKKPGGCRHSFHSRDSHSKINTNVGSIAE